MNIEKRYGKDVKLLWKDRKRYFGLPLSFTRYYLIENPGKWVKLIEDKGFLYEHIEELQMYRVDDLTIFESFFNKLFGVGCITVHCKDASSNKVYIKKIANPYKVYNLLSECLEQERARKKHSYAEFQG